MMRDSWFRSLRQRRRLLAASIIVFPLFHGHVVATASTASEQSGSSVPAPLTAQPIKVDVSFQRRLLSVTAVDVDIATVVKLISEKTGIEVALDPAITGMIRVVFTELSVEDGLAIILRALGEKNLAIEYSRNSGKTEGSFTIKKISILRKSTAETTSEPSDPQLLEAIRKRDQEYQEFFAQMDKEKNRFARALKEYVDPDTSNSRKVKLRTYIRQTPVENAADKKLLQGATRDMRYPQELRSDMQMALMHAIEEHPEESDKAYMLELLERKENLGWLYYSLLRIWDDRYIPYLMAKAKYGSLTPIEILGRAKVKEAVPLLEELLKSKDPSVRRNAQDALFQISAEGGEVKR